MTSDTLNGAAFDLADVTFTLGGITGPDGTSSTAISLNADGTVTIPAGTEPHMAGAFVTYTYTVVNNGDQIIRGVAISDTHNGSDPAPTPGNETLLTDVETV